MSSPEPAAPPPEDTKAEPAPRVIAWNPFTPSGLARYGVVPAKWLFLLQTITALFWVGAVFWFIRSAILPMVHVGAQNLPETGSIQNGVLKLGGPGGVLAKNSLVSCIIDPLGEFNPTDESDFTIALRERSILVCTRFGCLTRMYPATWRVPLGRSEVMALIGAWQPFFITGILAAVFMGLMLIWWSFSLFVAPIITFVAFFSDRQVSFFGAWRICGACLVPGALLLGTALVAYGWSLIDLLGFLIFVVIHFMLDWMYIGVVLTALPKVDKPADTAVNPFKPSPAAPEA